MASKGTQRENATRMFDKAKVAARYKELKDIITQNSAVPFKDVILKIAQINVGTFYNYIYPGNQMGQVSQYTVDNLSSYFNLPKDIFTSEAPLTEEIRKQLVAKISSDFGKNNRQQPQNLICADKYSITDAIKNISIHLNNENSIETLQQATKLLEITLSISNNRINSLTQLKNL